MDELAEVEIRPVLAPKRARSSRLAMLVPAVALIAIAWAGLSGKPANQRLAVPAPTSPIAERPADPEPPDPEPPDPEPPDEVLGLPVRALEDVEPRQLARDDVVALSGWYVATVITGCPPLAGIYREATLPEVRAADWREFCNRSGVLFASQPHLTDDQSTGSFEATQSGNAGVSVVTAWLAIGIVVPPELEVVDLDSTAVVVVGRFVESADACPVVPGCPRELMIDHVAWAAG